MTTIYTEAVSFRGTSGMILTLLLELFPSCIHLNLNGDAFLQLFHMADNSHMSARFGMQ